MNCEFSKKEFNEIPDRDKLERKFQLRSKFSNIALIIASIIDVFLIVELLILESQIKLLLFSLLSVGIAVYFHLRPQFQLIFMSKVELELLDTTEVIGKYTVYEINQMLRELLASYDGQEQPTIYLINDFGANAFVINSKIFNSIKPLNAVYVSHSIFDILERHEIKALLSHELAHFYKYLYPAYRIWLPLTLLFGLFPVYLLELFGAIAGNYVLTWLVVYWFLVIAGRQLLFTSDKTLEYLSDVYAAERHGKLNLINALITIIKHTEITEVILEESLRKIKENKNLSIENINEIIKAVEKELGDRIFTKTELVAAINSAFRSRRMKNLRKKIGWIKHFFEKNKLKESLQYFSEKDELDLYDWGMFDFAEKDLKISENEYPYLIKTLLGNPNKQLFHLIEDHHRKVVNLSHPTMRQRILFIEKSLKEAKPNAYF